MKITHLITTIERGGAENQLVVLVEQQVLMGHTVEIFFLKGKSELAQLFESVGAKVVRDYANKSPILQLIRLRMVFRNYSSILHCHLPRAELMGALMSRNCQETHLVITRHNTEKFFPKAPKIISSFLGRYVTKKAKMGIAISDAVAAFNYENSESHTNFQFKKVYYGYPSRALKPGDSGSNLIKLPSGKFVYGTIARLVPQKNISLLLQAFAALDSKVREESVVCIVGSGILEASLKIEASELGIQQQVIWIPRTSDAKKYLYEMDVFVLPSNYEGFGLVLLEAMEAKLPIIGANNTAISEVLACNSGQLFETNSVADLSQALSDMRQDKFRNSFVLAGQKRLEFFSPEKMSQEIFEVYQEALGER